MLDNIKNAAQSILSTEASKIYTPFSLFCLFFAIYFNATSLGKIFIASEWVHVSEGLAAISDKNWEQWLHQVSKITGYAISLTLIYGLGHLISALVWGALNYGNKSIAVCLDRHRFVLRKDLNSANQELSQNRDRLNASTAHNESLRTEYETREKSLLTDIKSYKEKNSTLTNELSIQNINQTGLSDRYLFLSDFITSKQESSNNGLTLLDILKDPEHSTCVARIIQVINHTEPPNRGGIGKALPFKFEIFSDEAKDYELPRSQFESTTNTEIFSLRKTIGALSGAKLGDINCYGLSAIEWRVDNDSLKELRLSQSGSE
jgi:hypothetical protein